MNCADFDEKADLILDNAVEPVIAAELKSHLAACKNCRDELILKQQAQRLLRNQPPLLPSRQFDERMRQAFKNHQKPPARKSGWAALFNFPNPFLRYAAATAVFILGCGLAFLSGRLSASQNVVMTAQTAQFGQNEPAQPLIEKSPSALQPAAPEATKTVTRYIKVPVVKQRIIEKKIYIAAKPEPAPQLPAETTADLKTKETREKIVEQFNLKNLQPFSTVSYKIIRKGELNEE